ncbi:hypothetical protein SUGI_0651200 [Cryptomeria japonica]|nr:hypothetical protein SUGI_0651200 [Cryptomeria japonica]
MTTKLFCSMCLRRSLFLKTPSHFRFDFSNLAENNVSNSNAPSQDLFAHFVTTRFNISSAVAAKMLKKEPTLERLKTLDKVEQLADMLNRHGCTEVQIANIIRIRPSLMKTSVERDLEPKIQLLKDLGVERENIPKIVTMSPNILASKLETLRSNLEFLKTVFPTNDFLVRAIMRSPDVIVLSLQNKLKPSIAFWEGFGFHEIEFIKFLSSHARFCGVVL